MVRAGDVWLEMAGDAGFRSGYTLSCEFILHRARLQRLTLVAVDLLLPLFPSFFLFLAEKHHLGHMLKHFRFSEV